MATTVVPGLPERPDRLVPELRAILGSTDDCDRHVPSVAGPREPRQDGASRPLPPAGSPAGSRRGRRGRMYNPARCHVTPQFSPGVCALTFFIGLGRPALTDSDEAFYAQSAREMMERDDWLTPYYNGQPRFDKPVLYYWAGRGDVRGVRTLCRGGAVSRRAGGCRSRARHLLLRAALVRPPDGAAGGPDRRHQRRHRRHGRGRRCRICRSPFFVTLSTWAALVALLTDPARAPAPRERRAWLLLAALAAALAFLVKGPVGPALVALVVLPSVALDWRRHGARRRPDGGRPGPGLRRLSPRRPCPGTSRWRPSTAPAIWSASFSPRTSTGSPPTATTPHVRRGYYLPIVFGGPAALVTVHDSLAAPPCDRSGAGGRSEPRALWLAVWACAPLAFYHDGPSASSRGTSCRCWRRWPSCSRARWCAPSTARPRPGGYSLPAESGPVPASC